jgi:uncharacterized oxidoreductase
MPWSSGPRDYRKGKGAIRAFGDHKGSGLAFMCEMLGGALSGNGATQEGRGFANGMFSFYVDPARLDPTGFFGPEVTRYADWVKSARPIESGGEILLPGEMEQRRRAERLATGVPLSDDTWAAIVATAVSVGLGEQRIAAASA